MDLLSLRAALSGVSAYLTVTGAPALRDIRRLLDALARGDGEAAPNAQVQEISRAVGLGGVTLPCDGGMVWVKRGSPFAQSVADGTGDDKVKRRYVNLDIEYITTY